MALSSASTDAEVWAAYDDNASFEQNGDAVKAGLFITACTILLRRRPVQVSTDGVSTAFEAGSISRSLERAAAVFNARAANNIRPNRYLDFSGLRN